MTPALIAIVCAATVGTSFLSGIFGMAGGMILIGILLAVMPVPEAMVLHSVTQMASNAWRGLLWIGHVRWRAVAAYIAGCALILAVWSLIRYVPSKPVALLLLGVTPFLARLLPADLKPDPESPVQGVVYGAVCMALVLLTGVAGPLADMFFLGGKLDRRQIVATKAMCQIFAHAAKLLYFGAVVEQAAGIDPVAAGLAVAAALLGTVLARRVLEAMSDMQYRAWTNRIVTAIAGYYVVSGSYLFLVS
jgi:uncharacterized protein